MLDATLLEACDASDGVDDAVIDTIAASQASRSVASSTAQKALWTDRTHTFEPMRIR